MAKLKLNKNMGELVTPHSYELDATEKYVITFSDEIEQQSAIMGAIQAIGLEAMSDYHN